MEPFLENKPAEMPGQKSGNKKFILAVIILFVIAAGYLVWQNLDFLKEKYLRFSVKGSIILTLQSPEPGKEAGIYSYSVSAGELEEIYVKEKTKSVFSSAVVSPQGDSLAFIERNETGTSAINVLDLKTKELKTLVSSSLIGEIFSYLNWSPDGSSIVYGSLIFDPDAANFWKIYTVDLKGNQKLITQGYAMPRFTSQETIGLFRGDGFWEIDLKTGETRRLSEELALVNNIQYDVSDDLSMMVWTIPAENFFHLTGLEKSGGGFVRKNDRRMDELIYSPFLSPDKKCFAAMKSGNLIIADTKNINFFPVLDLKDFSITPIMITDWAIINLN